MSQGKMFTCDHCGEREECSNEEEARAEYEANFNTPFVESEVNIICDYCYEKIKAWAKFIGDNRFQRPY